MHLGVLQNIQWPEGTSQQTQFENAVEQAVLAESLGFHSAYFVEHHWTRHGILSSTLALLSYIAARTTTLRLGTAVLVLPFHDPARLAEEAATVDLLSHGRLELGVGRGFQWTEFNGFGLALEESRDRYDEALDVILRAWREPGTFSHAGKYWTYNDISVEPKPLQRPHPGIWIAVSSPDSARRAGRDGLRMLMSSGVRFERLPLLIDAYKEGLAENGHAYSSEHVLLSRVAHIAETRELAWERALPHYNWFRKMVAAVSPAPGQESNFNPHPLPPKLSGPIGSAPDDPGILFCTPDDACRYVEQVEPLGIGNVIFQGNWGGIPHEYVLNSLRLIGSEVIPHFAPARAGAADS